MIEELVELAEEISRNAYDLWLVCALDEECRAKAFLIADRIGMRARSMRSQLTIARRSILPANLGV